MSIHFSYDRADDVRYRIDADAATEILRMLTDDDTDLASYPPADDPDPFTG